MKIRFWQTSRVAAQRHASLCMESLVEILNFVSNELDREPGHWRDYFTNPKAQILVDALEREHRNSDIFGEEEDEEGEEDVDRQDRVADIFRGSVS